MTFEKGQKVKVVSVPKGEEDLEFMTDTIGAEGIIIVRKIDDKNQDECHYDYGVAFNVFPQVAFGYMEENLELVGE